MAIKPVKVSQVNTYIKRLLQSDPVLSRLSVVGEISNLKYHGSGHVYFTLKDADSKLNCFLAASVLPHIRFELADGMEVIAEGNVSVYERGGTYSLNVQDISVSGTGGLALAFEKLKNKLEGEGLFDPAHKKEIPFFPRRIAVVTSETGAAVRDILKIIQGRNNVVDILVCPTLVQGPGAAPDIAKNIARLNSLKTEIDCMIVGRGGGSMEELWAFNEEIVARAIFASNIPVISAVGHETDFTIADFVADRRAETPTAAAHIAAPDTRELARQNAAMFEELGRNTKNRLAFLENRVREHSAENMRRALRHKAELAQMRAKTFVDALSREMRAFISDRENGALMAKQKLDALDPQLLMSRGYVAITREDGRLIRSVLEIDVGAGVTALLADGTIGMKVVSIKGKEKKEIR